jgi:two-component system, NtrC family, nitrogen regulation sensor histidine kinase NtrY
MDFNNLYRYLGVRLGILSLTLFFLGHLIADRGLFPVILIVIGLAVLQAISLIRNISASYAESRDFLERLKKGERIYKYKIEEREGLKGMHFQLYNDIIDKVEETKKANEEEFQYLKNIVQHIGIGILTLDQSGEIQICNRAAKSLLQAEEMSSLDDLKAISPELADIILELRTGGRGLIKLEGGEESPYLSVFVIELMRKGKLFKLVSIQNIKSELDEKEMEAWQNLVRVLTHEIRNSVTPIASLSTTADEMLVLISDWVQQNPEAAAIRSDLDDVQLSLKTISKRSKGLIHFVNDFRSLTHTPQPKLQQVQPEALFEQICLLMKKEIEKHNVIVQVEHQEGLTFTADPELISQVLINLIKNAIEAFDEQQEKKIIALKSFLNEKNRYCIQISDNGKGIEKDALNSIFIPFFTTKKTGSGIGLSLSREILRKHGGSISVKSELNAGTEFTLKF